MSPDPRLDGVFTRIAGAMQRGKVVPLLGAGANACDRPPDGDWRSGESLPTGAELAELLAREYAYPDSEPRDLARVSEFADFSMGTGSLYDTLHDVFAGRYAPNSLHRLLARMPAALGHPLLVVTTNYDDALEQALTEAGEPFDLLVYIADAARRDEGHLVHVPHEGGRQIVRRPTEYKDIHPDRRTVVLKLHGAVNREDSEHDSYVITEEHYLEYLTRANLKALVPATVLARLARSHFLFLGYGLRDWNLRVMLHRLWDSERDYRAWAIQRDAGDLDVELWKRHSVDVHAASLAACVARLSELLGLADEPAPAAG